MPIFHSAAFRKITESAGDRSTTQIAARTGLDRGLIARLLNGSRQPTLQTAARLADAYEIGVDDLINRSEAA